ncbi:hypothetical protein BS17DRAFT_770994 [Gyrodon lividus]|nr:hypothetical protein BS17DRAFT_770994 [Gyrodon lividus]
MAWGVFYRPPQYSDWDNNPQSEARDGHSLSFIKEYSSYESENPPRPPPQPSRQPPHLLISSSQSNLHAQRLPPIIRNPTTPQFKTPLSGFILSDPAFSSDPRSHPHFPLTNAGSYKEPPSKSPRSYPRHVTRALPVSLSHEAQLTEENALLTNLPPHISHQSLIEEPHPSPSSAPVFFTTHSTTFTSPTVISVSSRSHPPTQTPGGRIPTPVALVSSSNPNSSSPPRPQRNGPSPPVQQIPDHPSCNMCTPELRLTAQKPSIPTRVESAPILSENKKGIVGKGRMRNLVRPVTDRNNLDRIDELDETDPFGGGYHHDGPYEAIGSSLAELDPPPMYNDIDALRGDLHNSKREPATRPSRRVKHKSSSRVPPVEDENGSSLHLEPGQILQQNTMYPAPVYNAPTSMSTVPYLSRRKPVTSVTRPDHSRSQSLPNPPTVTSFPHPPNNYSSPSGPRVHYFGDNIPRIPNSSLFHIDRDAAPYALPATVLPPNQHESVSRSSSPIPSPQPIPPSPTNLMSPQSQPMKRPMTDFPPQGSRHRSVRSLDSSRTLNPTIAHSSSSQNRSLEHPRTRHLPKRLIMPAPLQREPLPTQPPFPQPQYHFAPVQYPDRLRLEKVHFEGPPAMYGTGRRLLRKKSSNLPAKRSIPAHAPMSQAEPVPTIGNFPSKADNDAERIKEGTRRRRLSKRKNDN